MLRSHSSMSFRLSARRDGPGSNKGLPALQHLVNVSRAENKLNEAISFQKTVLAFTKAAKAPDAGAIIQEQCNLSKSVRAERRLCKCRAGIEGRSLERSLSSASA